MSTEHPQAPAGEPRPQSIEFGGRIDIDYDSRVLAPRPWTMAQSSWAAELHEHGPGGRVLELCAGAGHIGLLALVMEGAEGVLVDVDPVACTYAESNASRAGLQDSVEVRCGDMGSVVGSDETFGVVIADPPWVPSAGIEQYPEDPALAIDGGADGLDLTRACLTVADKCLHPEGAVVLQLGNQGQIEAVSSWLDGQPGLDLVIWEWRSYEPNGVLVGLRRKRSE